MERAQHALIDPLIEPDPSDETGLNAHFRSTFAPQQPITPPGSHDNSKGPTVKVNNTGSSVETNPYRRSRASSEAKNPFMDQREIPSPSRRRYDYPSPPNSASPRREHFNVDHRSTALGPMNEGRPRRSSNPAPNQYKSNGLGRSGSLRERYPGDMSHRPLDTLRKDEKTAYRAPHLRKKNFPGADIIDRLDGSGPARYHHEGPYDAASLARNKNVKYPPIEAVRETNEEALRATPKENVVNAVTKHRPLEGVADIPPGVADPLGRVLHYEEGADLQREPGGDYRRWPGVDYHPDDLKGKGEPSYTIEKALKDHKQIGVSGTEMKSHHRHSRSIDHNDAPGIVPSQAFDEDEAGVRRSNTTGRSVDTGLKKRFGSLRRRKDVEA